jgi:glycosyltransferase involved in cell wall biosynthesis
MNTTKMTPISIAIITCNEQRNLLRCLQSVSFASQIVVVDSGSTDDTVKIAQEFGCDVFEEPWKGFGPQKQFAIDRCRNPWILVLDADERIPEETARAIGEIVFSPQETASGFSFPRKNFFQGRWIRHAGWWPDRVVRLFRRGRGRISPDPVHESVEVEGVIRDLDFPLEHFTESRLSEILRKIDRYSTLGAQKAFSDGQTSSAPAAFCRAILTFVHDYAIRGGFLDGAPGLTLAVTDSINKFFKYAKLAELNRMAKKEVGNGDPSVNPRP